MYIHLCQWKFKTPIPEDGVIAGCANNQEWMLPWWYMNYSQHNQYPITFIDFGDMSSNAKTWCQERGQLISLDIPTNEFILDKSKINPKLAHFWSTSTAHGENIWQVRLEFFKKPFACLASPYLRSIWIDLDCQIFKSIKPIFDACETPQGIAAAEESSHIRLWHAQRGSIEIDEREYNTGVLAFKHGIPLIIEWAKYCIKRGSHVYGDQDAFCHMLYEKEETIPTLSPIYNWKGSNILENENDCNQIVILHWMGRTKNMIQIQIDHYKERGMNLSI